MAQPVKAQKKSQEAKSGNDGHCLHGSIEPIELGDAVVRCIEEKHIEAHVPDSKKQPCIGKGDRKKQALGTLQ